MGLTLYGFLTMAIHKDEITNHRILNYLCASLQGRFAYYNILSQLEHPSFSLEELETTKGNIRSATEWLKGVYTGTLLFSGLSSGPKGAEGKEAFEILNKLKGELSELAIETKRLVATPDYYSDRANAGLLIAAFGRSGYARDNYVRGYVDYGTKTNDKELVTMYKQHFPEVRESVNLANNFLAAFRDTEGIELGFYEHLRFFCRTLAGTFRSHVHDVNQLLNAYQESFSYEMAEFFKPEAKAWHEAGLTAVEAGYWRAHEMSIQDAYEWTAYAFVDPLLVAEWKTAGFSPDYSALWRSVRFTPLLAIQWHNAGFQPAEAAFLLAEGHENPDEIPESERDALRKHAAEAMKKADEAPKKQTGAKKRSTDDEE